jgi:hypothetical protein
MARPRAKPLVFRGTGRALNVALPEAWADAPEVPRLELDAPEAQGAEAQLVMLRGGRGPGLRVRLPPTAPPGRYEGALRLGRQKRAVVVEVPETARLKLIPNEVSLTAATGGEPRASVVALNQGNVDLELPESPELRFFQSPGLDREPGRVFEVRVPGLDPVFARTDELQVSTAAVAQLVLLEGAGTLAPGEERPLEIAVRVDAEAAPGLRYFGEWSFADETFALILDVDQAGPTPQEDS